MGSTLKTFASCQGDDKEKKRMTIAKLFAFHANAVNQCLMFNFRKVFIKIR